MMETRRGIAVSPGIAIGEVFLLESEGVRIPQHFIAESEVQGEVDRLERAMSEALEELEELADRVRFKAGPTIAEIFSSHAGMLRDEYFRAEFVERIRDKRYTAEFAVSRTMRQWRKVFHQDSFLAGRVADLDDLERRLLRKLLGAKREELATLKTEIILVAHDLAPSQTASLDADRVKAIAIDAGGPTGHSAIIARALGIPAVVGLGALTDEISGGDTVIVDGLRGLVIVDPDEEVLDEYRVRQSAAIQSEINLMEELRDQPAVTTDDRHVGIMANIEFPREVAGAIRHGAEGIGLYRTEFLYLTSERQPTEREHYDAYVEAIEHLNGQPIIIRTVDLGADKFVAYAGGMLEKNPFLGRRSIRYCLDHPEILREQLRAILRASVHGDVRVMFPLISSLQEVLLLKEMLANLRQEFEYEKRDYDHDMQVGVMIEVPSAAIAADTLAEHVDFFSIGTNDLIQYTLAIDRANEHVAHLYRPLHPAVLKLLKMAVDAGHRKGIDVGICGEMGSDLAYTILLLGMEIDHFSVAPPAVVSELKKIIRSVSYEDARAVARRVFACADSDAAYEVLTAANHELVPDIFP
jgi:phosphotransferase system enzyme I (PtsI)